MWSGVWPGVGRARRVAPSVAKIWPLDIGKISELLKSGMGVGGREGVAGVEVAEGLVGGKGNL